MIGYSALLKKHPIITNSITTGSLFAVGDAIAQIGFEDGPFDYKRTTRSIFYGSVIFAFIGDRWYKILSRVKYPGARSLTNEKLNKTRDTITRVAFDQLVWAPIGIPLYYSVMSVLEGKSFEDTKRKLETHWWETLTTNWIVWPTFQLINFSVMPVHHQLLSVNVFSIFWNTYLSMKNSKKLPQDQKPVYYPPLPE